MTTNTTSSIGGIYSDETCIQCGSNFVDNRYDGLYCPSHPDQRATSFKARVKSLTTRHSSYLDASSRLAQWRREIKDGTFDIRTYQKDSRLTLDRVCDEFLSNKDALSRRGKIKESTVKSYRARLLLALFHIGPSTLVTKVGFREIESFILNCDRSPKTVGESFRCLKEMLTWAYHCGDLPKMPRFPKFSVTENDMRMRKTITKTQQVDILAKIKENEWERAPRKYIACKMLATYVNIRPGELRNVRERDYNRETGYLTIRRHKTSSHIPKVIKLVRSDRALLNGLPRGFPDLPLFRYDKSYSNVKVGDGFGEGALYRCWKEAAVSLGHSRVDLYGGTRHSSCIALYKEVGLSPEEIRRASGTRTSKVFMRYLPLDVEDVAEIHRHAEPQEVNG
jgi:integrase